MQKWQEKKQGKGEGEKKVLKSKQKIGKSGKAEEKQDYDDTASNKFREAARMARFPQHRGDEKETL